MTNPYTKHLAEIASLTKEISWYENQLDRIEEEVSYAWKQHWEETEEDPFADFPTICLQEQAMSDTLEHLEDFLNSLVLDPEVIPGGPTTVEWWAEYTWNHRNGVRETIEEFFRPITEEEWSRVLKVRAKMNKRFNDWCESH